MGPYTWEAWKNQGSAFWRGHKKLSLQNDEFFQESQMKRVKFVMRQL